MVDYEVKIFPSELLFSSTVNDVTIKLVGTDGASERKSVNSLWTYITGALSKLTVSCTKSIGKLVMIELKRDSNLILRDDAWFPAKFEVTSPEGDIYQFPVYHWINTNDVHIFREGKAILPFEDTDHTDVREMELGFRRRDYEWCEYLPGIPHCIAAKDVDSLSDEVHFSFTKKKDLGFTLFGIFLNGLTGAIGNWAGLDSIFKMFLKSTDMSDYLLEHWKDDEFFSYQFLNGVNPMVIRRCSALPENLPVTDDMVFPSGEHSLEDELKSGNIYLCDYKLLDGIEANTVNEKEQYLMAPLVLLHKTGDKLMPLAIQLKQKPGKDNPIFLPTDSESDWLLAKIFVRSAEFTYHQLHAHLMRTHLLAEVFAVSLLRNVPMVHPLYKLLVPHTRYTLQINVMARLYLISGTGFFAKYSASGTDGTKTILQKSLSEITYSSLCIPEDIAERGLEDVPNFHYRDDGLKLWGITNRFVEGVLTNYYKKDDDVQKDTELQKWISDIFEEGFLSNTDSGIPQKFDKVDELVKFVTMVIFTCSAQHSAVNSGQLDFGAWMPNFAPSMEHPPPTSKGKSDKDTILKSLPGVSATLCGIGIMYLLSQQSSDFVPLGQYPEQHFSEANPLNQIKKFKRELEDLESKIKERNEKLALPYTYLLPSGMENSVTI